MRVLVTGIAGKIGRIVAELLLARGHDVAGIDLRAWHGAPDAIALHQADIRKRAAQEVFRQWSPEAVIHMATVTHLTATSEDRFRINLYGTRAVFDNCAAHGVRRAIFVGRHTYYGAAPDAPLYHKEDDPPMAVSVFPELADLVAADLYAGTALWRFPGLQTAVLRICYTLGAARQGTLAAFLAGARVPTVLGFDPLFQFMHEHDAAAAICTALEAELHGVYNVSGPDPVPLSMLVREAGRQVVPVPETLLKLATGRLGLPRLPRGAIAHVKYPVVVDSTRFRDATGFEHEFDEVETIASFRSGSRG